VRATGMWLAPDVFDEVLKLAREICALRR